MLIVISPGRELEREWMQRRKKEGGRREEGGRDAYQLTDGHVDRDAVPLAGLAEAEVKGDPKPFLPTPPTQITCKVVWK